MACQWVKINGIVAHFNLPRNRRIPTCKYCKCLVARECDFVINRDVDNYKTCDAQLCSLHYIRVAHEVDHCGHHCQIKRLGEITVSNIQEEREGIYIGTEAVDMDDPRFTIHASPLITKNLSLLFLNGDLEAATKEYKQFLWNAIKAQHGDVFDELIRLRDQITQGYNIKLLGFSKQLSKHGDVIKSAIEWMIRQVVK